LFRRWPRQCAGFGVGAGLGTIFVQPNRKIGWRPVIAAAYGGLIVYGLVQRSRSKDQYKRYESQSDEQQAEPFMKKQRSSITAIWWQPGLRLRFG
jgi:hypothetical protein